MEAIAPRRIRHPARKPDRDGADARAPPESRAAVAHELPARLLTVAHHSVNGCNLQPLPARPLTIGVKYISYPEHSGYGLTALAYVRALHNAGFRSGGRRAASIAAATGARHLGIRTTARPPTARLRSGERCRSCRTSRLVAKTRPQGLRHRDLQTVPEHWPAARRIRQAATSARPSGRPTRCRRHWLPLLNAAGQAVRALRHEPAPCSFAKALRSRSGRSLHIRRHTWNEASCADRLRVAAPARHSRRSLPVLFDQRLGSAQGARPARRANSRACSCGDDKVLSLVLKTSTAVHRARARPGTARRDPRARARHCSSAIAKRDAAAAAAGRRDRCRRSRRAGESTRCTRPAIASSRWDTGEGWGMGAFDAAALGRPVLIAGFGGPSEYLRGRLPGADLLQRWCLISGWLPGGVVSRRRSAGRSRILTMPRALLRRMVARHADFLEPAARASERIANRYAEPVVAHELIAAIDA